MKKTLIFAVLLSFASGAVAEEIVLHSSPASFKVLPGAPLEFRLSIRNASEKSLRLRGATLAQALAPKGGLLIPSGREALDCSSSATSTVTSDLPPSQCPTLLFSPGEVFETTYGIYSQRYCPLRDAPPGQYVGRVWVEAQVCEGANLRTINAVLEIPVTIEAPSGQDEACVAALEKAAKNGPPKFSGPFQGELKWMEVLHSMRIQSELLILSRFPSSTYAAYVVYQRSGAEGMAKSDPAKVAEAVTNGWTTRGEIWVPSETTKDKSGLAPLRGDAAAKWRQKWIGSVLNAYPGIWFADDLRLNLAADQVALKNYQGGAADLEVLSKQAEPGVAQKAQAILDEMKQRGWIKAKGGE